jgi:small subunit ribosomal protein S16
MLVIRMQRTGRKGHAMFRVVVQDSRLTPTSGKVVAFLGSYDPHAKTISIDKDKVALYIKNGAQPSERVARLLKQEGVKLPEWVKLPDNKQRTVRNADKRRSTRPPEPVEDVEPAAAEVEAESIEEVAAAEAPVTTEAEAKDDTEAAETPAAEVPAEETSVETEAAPVESVENVSPEVDAAPPETDETGEPAKA